MLKLKKRGRFLNQKGFTLIELMVVVVILGILAAIVVPKFTNQTDKAREKRAMAEIKTIKTSVDVYAAEHDNNEYPTIAEIDNLLKKDGFKAGLTDPWGNRYRYHQYDDPDNTKNDYAVLSSGPNGQLNDADDIYATQNENPVVGDPPASFETNQVYIDIPE